MKGVKYGAGVLNNNMISNSSLWKRLSLLWMRCSLALLADSVTVLASIPVPSIIRLSGICRPVDETVLTEYSEKNRKVLWYSA